MDGQCAGGQEERSKVVQGCTDGSRPIPRRYRTRSFICTMHAVSSAYDLSTTGRYRCWEPRERREIVADAVFAKILPNAPRNSSLVEVSSGAVSNSGSMMMRSTEVTSTSQGDRIHTNRLDLTQVNASDRGFWGEESIHLPSNPHSH